MLVYSQYAIIAALVATVAAAVTYTWAVFRGHQEVVAASATKQRPRVLVGSGDGIDEFDDLVEEPAARPVRNSGPAPASLGRLGSTLAWIALGLLTVSLVLRTLATGHGPFVTQHEFAVSTSWGFLAVYLIFEWRYRARTLALLMLPITAAMQLYALSWSATADPLVPALQNSLLLTTSSP